MDNELDNGFGFSLLDWFCSIKEEQNSGSKQQAEYIYRLLHHKDKVKNNIYAVMKAWRLSFE
jgi:hypothetical protein